MTSRELRLFEAAKAGDVTARNIIVESYLSMVDAIVSKSYASDRERRDDLLQVGYEALMSTVQTYDKDRAEFKTYASRAVRNAINRYLSAERNAPDPVDDLTEPDAGELHASKDEDQFAAIENQEFVRERLTSLSDRERELVERHFGLNGYNETSLSQIADVDGVTRQAVSKIFNRALERMRSD